MSYLSKHILSLMIIALVYSNNQYQYAKTIESIGDRDKIAFSHDDAWMISYGGTQNAMNMYSAFTFQKIFSINTTRTYLRFFENENKQKSFISGDKDGNIYYTFFDNNENQSSGQMILNRLSLPVIKVLPNSQNTKYAAICDGSTSIYIGSLTKSTEIQTIEVNQTINSFVWHPQSDLIAIALEPNENYTVQLLIYDYNKKTFQDYSQHIPPTSAIIDLQYSEDGSQIAYISKNTTQQVTEQIITILNLKNFTQDYLVALQSNRLIGIQRQGTMLTAYDQSYTYVWKFNSNYYGKYPSILKSIGLSRSASYIIALDSLSQTLLVYKFCIQNNQCFMNQFILCGNCGHLCLSCFTSQQKCSSCNERYFLKYSDYTCVKCMDNCRLCSKMQTCQTCDDGFYYADNQCQLCSTGCVKCNQKDTCLSCDSINHWKLNQQTSKCVCQDKFFLNNDKCDACIKGCLQCQNQNECKTCDGESHRVLQPTTKKCSCDQRYFQNEDQCKPCIKGCLTCSDNVECSACDTINNWIMNQKKCTCNYGFYDGGIKCKPCSSILQQCLNCKTKDICLECSQGYSIDADTNKCVKNQDGVNTVTIILSVLAGCVVIGVAIFFIVKIIKKRNAKKVETLLEDQQQLKSNE